MTTLDTQNFRNATSENNCPNLTNLSGFPGMFRTIRDVVISIRIFFVTKFMLFCCIDSNLDLRVIVFALFFAPENTT